VRRAWREGAARLLEALNRWPSYSIRPPTTTPQRLRAGQEAGVLDREYGLVCTGADQFNLPVDERHDGVAAETDALAELQHCSIVCSGWAAR
jgi:hypothetical protein